MQDTKQKLDKEKVQNAKQKQKLLMYEDIFRVSFIIKNLRVDL